MKAGHRQLTFVRERGNTLVQVRISAVDLCRALNRLHHEQMLPCKVVSQSVLFCNATLWMPEQSLESKSPAWGGGGGIGMVHHYTTEGETHLICGTP